MKLHTHFVCLNSSFCLFFLFFLICKLCIIIYHEIIVRPLFLFHFSGTDGPGDTRLIYGTIVVEEKDKPARVDKVTCVH
jgi:hypothetical protein